MPGICGIVTKHAGGGLATQLRDMLARLRHHPWYQEHHEVEDSDGVALGRMSLGIVNTAPQPASNEDASVRAVMEGEIYNYSEERAELERRGHRFQGQSHAELLVHGYESDERRFFTRLHGSFVAAIWDRRNRRLILTNDRFGTKLLYYAALPQKLLVASEIKSLLADPELPRHRNPRGLAQFFTFGQFLGDDTFFDAIRAVPAAAWITYHADNGRLDVDRYWQLGQTPRCNGATERAMLDCVADSFKAAVDRRVNGVQNLGISLSGGLDARTILALIDTRHTPTTSVCIGIDGSLDHRSAKELARIAGSHHHSFTLNSQFLEQFEQHLRQMVHLTDGHYLSQCIVMPTLPVYRELGIRVLLRGHAGELMHMDKAYNFSLDAEALAISDESSLENWLLRHLQTYITQGITGPLFGPELDAQVEALSRDSLKACLAESRGMEPLLHRIWHLFVTQRSRREIALSMVKFGSLMETRLPYLDNDLVDLLLAIPPQLKISDRIQSHILHMHRPAFLDVTNVNTGTRLGAGRLRRAVSSFRMRVLAKLGVRGYQPYERLGRWLRQELRPLVSHLLLSDRFLTRGIFNPQTVKATVEHHLNGQRNHTFLLLALMIFEIGQREFIDGDSPVNGAHDVPGEACRPSLAESTRS